jgi:hypothetical protein
MRDYLGAYFVLNNDIDASATATWNSGAGWVPVGTSATAFTGNFNGQLKVIRGLTINRPTEEHVGLFGYAHSNNYIEKLGFLEADIVGYSRVGTVVGSAISTNIQYIWASGNVEGAGTVGGLLGHKSWGGVSYSFSMVDVTGSTGAVGGLVGLLQEPSTTLSYSYATGKLSGSTGTGGLIGDARGSVSYSYSLSDIYSPDGWIGGLVGSGSGNISYSFARGNVYSGGSSVGGLVGRLDTASVSYSLAEGHLYAAGSSGGLVSSGLNAPTVSYSLATGKNLSTSGGQFHSTGATITKSYAFDWGTGKTCTSTTTDANCTLVTTGTTKPFAFRFSRELEFVQMKHLESTSIPMRKISATDKAAYKVWGSCTVHGATINISATGGATTVNDTTTCSAYSWEKLLNLSTLNDGAVTITADQAGADVRTLNLIKETSYCDANPSNGDFAAGDGSVGTPYLICTTAQFDKVRNYTTAGTYFTLKNNLDLSEGFSGPIGTNANADCTSRFCGKFNGNGFMVRDAYIVQPTAENVGIFGMTADNTSVIEKLAAENIYVMGDHHVGGLIGQMSGGTVQNVYIQGSVTGVGTTGYVTGMVGSMTSGVGLLTKSMANVHVISRGQNSAGMYNNESGSQTISYVSAHGNIVSSNNVTGGLQGTYLTNLTKSYATGHVISSGYLPGGLAGIGMATDSFATGSVITSNTTSGGLVGIMQGGSAQTRRSYAAGHIISSSDRKGGIAGGFFYNSGIQAIDSFAVGHVTSNGSDVGALVGYLMDQPSTKVVNSSYWTQANLIGACIGQDDNTTDADTCNPAGPDYSLFSTFTSDTAVYDNWDFPNTWKFPSGGGLPILNWQYEP